MYIILNNFYSLICIFSSANYFFIWNMLYLYFDFKCFSMTIIQNQIEINAPVARVFEYYTNPDNIKESWPRDIVKESENVSGQKSEEGSEMKVTGEYMGKKDEMILEVVQKEQNKRLVTKQTEGPFQRWESIQEFQSSGNGNTSTTTTTTTTLVNHTIN